jgi:hypothetical protein
MTVPIHVAARLVDFQLDTQVTVFQPYADQSRSHPPGGYG